MTASPPGTSATPVATVPIVRSLEDVPARWQAGVVAIGNFDGIHRGHRKLVARLVDMARTLGAAPLVFTFDPPPLTLLRPGVSPQPLTTMERRAELLAALGVEGVIAYRTTPELLELDARTFFERFLVQSLQIRGLVEGPNFRFGKNRLGDIPMLQGLCQEQGIRLAIVDAEVDGDAWVSSTGIRELILNGDVQLANRFLESPYRLQGRGVHGDGRGRTIGFPTANLGDVPVLIPAHGVYAARVMRSSLATSTGQRNSPVGHGAAVHIGPSPTFGNATSKVEVHILDFDGDLYGTELEIEVLGRVRTVMKFHGLEALLAQIQSDLATVESMLSLQPRNSNCGV